MKAQLKVGGGDGNLPSIPGITGARYPETYSGARAGWGTWIILLLCLLSAALTVRGLGRWV